ncbi:hypothetical protein SUDANB51_06668 [Streptomyces sp. enrichment culture]
MPHRSRACIFSSKAWGDERPAIIPPERLPERLALQEVVKAVADAAELLRELLRYCTDDRCFTRVLRRRAPGLRWSSTTTPAVGPSEWAPSARRRPASVSPSLPKAAQPPLRRRLRPVGGVCGPLSPTSRQRSSSAGTRRIPCPRTVEQSHRDSVPLLGPGVPHHIEAHLRLGQELRAVGIHPVQAGQQLPGLASLTQPFLNHLPARPCPAGEGMDHLLSAVSCTASRRTRRRKAARRSSPVVFSTSSTRLRMSPYWRPADGHQVPRLHWSTSVLEPVGAAPRRVRRARARPPAAYQPTPSTTAMAASTTSPP